MYQKRRKLQLRFNNAPKQLILLLSALILIIPGIAIAASPSCDGDTTCDSYECECGPYDELEIETITVSTDPVITSRIYRPKILFQAHPIAVFCGGYGENDAFYDSMLLSIASHGVVVIEGNSNNQAVGEEAIAGLNWLIDENSDPNSDYYGKLNTSKVLYFGHSQGGRAAMHASIDVNSPPITAVLALMPAWALPPYIDTGALSDPILYIAGDDDIFVPQWTVRIKYSGTDNAPAWYGSRLSAAHSDWGDDRIQYYVRAWIYAQLFDDSAAREEFYGPNWKFLDDEDFRMVRKNNDQDL